MYGRIEDNLNKIENFFKGKNRNLLDGRRLQSSINQDNIIYLLRDNEEVLKVANKIKEVSEMEQDSINGIEENLKQLSALIKELLKFNK
jgi:uncharacterized ferredoxin-like protein